MGKQILFGTKEDLDSLVSDLGFEDHFHSFTELAKAVNCKEDAHLLAIKPFAPISYRIAKFSQTYSNMLKNGSFWKLACKVEALIDKEYGSLRGERKTRNMRLRRIREENIVPLMPYEFIGFIRGYQSIDITNRELTF